MVCPNCNYDCGDLGRFCPYCGTPLTAQVSEKKGRHWVPILIMVLIFSIGTGLFFALPGDSSAGKSDTPWFRMEDGVLHFSKTHYNGGSELHIPESIDGMPVTALADNCFENCTELTSVILPSSLRAIGENAFRGCTALRGIEIPEGVQLIGKGAFSGCTALESINIQSNIRSIGQGAFSGCEKLLYIFFVGSFRDWNTLYPEFITPFTAVFCTDGSYYQGGDPN